MNEEHTLHRKTRAAKTLLSSMRDILGDDEELINDTLEGETDLFEALESAANVIDEESILIEGIKARTDALEDRKRTSQLRIDRIRSMIEQALMLSSDETTFRLPSMTLTLRKVLPKPVIRDEAAIPAKYWTEQKRPAPKLDKKTLAEDLKAGTEVPGAELDNGGSSLTIRRK